MTATSKQSLISESVVVIWIGVHHAGEKPNNTLHARSRGLHVQQPFVKSLLCRNRAPAPGIKSWFSTIVRPSRHPILPHSRSIELPWSRKVRFNIIVTKLLGLSDSIKVWHAINTILNLLIKVKTTRSLIDTDEGYHLWASDNYGQPFPSDDTPLSPIYPAWWH
jgi:hypothetical protein